MDDAGLMCRFDRGANLFQNIDDPRDRKRTFLGNDLISVAESSLVRRNSVSVSVAGKCGVGEAIDAV